MLVFKWIDGFQHQQCCNSRSAAQKPTSPEFWLLEAAKNPFPLSEARPPDAAVLGVCRSSLLASPALLVARRVGFLLSAWPASSVTLLRVTGTLPLVSAGRDLRMEISMNTGRTIADCGTPFVLRHPCNSLARLMNLKVDHGRSVHQGRVCLPVCAPPHGLYDKVGGRVHKLQALPWLVSPVAPCFGV